MIFFHNHPWVVAAQMGTTTGNVDIAGTKTVGTVTLANRPKDYDSPALFALTLDSGGESEATGACVFV